MLDTKKQDIPEVHTPEVDKYRNTITITDIIGKVRNTLHAISSIDAVEGLNESITKYFSAQKYKQLRSFFRDHPHVYKDLIRKVHKHRAFKDNSWEIDENKKNDIATLFLVRNRQENLGKKVEEFLGLIFDNSGFIEYCSAQPSILDYSAYQFSRIPSGKRKNDIEKLIIGGLVQNIKGCTESNVHDYYIHSFKAILPYIQSIFGIYVEDLEYCRDIRQLSEKLNSLLQQGGKNRKKAWKVVQGFHAWGNIQAISRLHDDAQQKITKMPEKLRKIGIVLGSVRSDITPDGVKIFSSTTQVNQKEVTLSWRVKTIPSILLKMWETEEYTNADAMRDLIGLSVVYPDDTTEQEKIEIMFTFGKLMPNSGYILKDKGELPNQDGALDELESRLQKYDKKPLYVSIEKGDSTHKNMQNASMSGFSQIGGLNIGFEVQFSTVGAMEWKKNDDKKYKIRSNILALIRGPKEVTPQELLNMLNMRISPDSLKQLGCSTINDLIIELVQESFLIPYISKDSRVLLFTTKKYEKQFTQAWNNEKLIKEPNITEASRKYIDSLSVNL